MNKTKLPTPKSPLFYNLRLNRMELGVVGNSVRQMLHLLGDKMKKVERRNLEKTLQKIYEVIDDGERASSTGAAGAIVGAPNIGGADGFGDGEDIGASDQRSKKGD